MGEVLNVSVCLYLEHVNFLKAAYACIYLQTSNLVTSDIAQVGPQSRSSYSRKCHFAVSVLSEEVSFYLHLDNFRKNKYLRLWGKGNLIKCYSTHCHFCPPFWFMR